MKKNKKNILIISSVATVIIALCFFIFYNMVLKAKKEPPKPNESVVYEAGEELPDAGSFFTGNYDEVEFVTDLTSLSLDVPGIYCKYSRT